MPQDQSLALGHAISHLPVPPGGLTLGGLLGHILGYYSQPVSLDPAAAALLRSVGGGGGEGGDGGTVARAALLGCRLALEGVSRATRDPVGAVYEVCLSL